MTNPAGSTSAPGGAFFSHKVVSGATWAILNKAVLFLVVLGVQIFTPRVLGPEKYGVLSLCLTIGETLIIFCGLGLNTALVRFVPELMVDKNRAGIVRMVLKTGLLQMGAVAGAGVLLFVMRPQFDAWFNVAFGSLLIIAVGFTAARMFKTLMDDAFTALFQVRTTSALSLIQGLLWFALLLALLPPHPTPHTALWIQIGTLSSVAIVEAFLLRRYLRGLDWQSPRHGIGKRRTIKIASASFINAIANVFMRQYSELFFLGVFFSKSVVGWYALGCVLPLQLITFLPSGLQTLFTSGFAEAYSRDKGCLPKLIATYYKALIVTVLPVSIFGFFAAPRLIGLLFGDPMKEAGPIASLFFLVHMQGLLSVPLSMAIVVKEKILNMQPLMLLTIGVNLLLDYLLIPRYGMYGAVGAVFGTFFLTIPIRLYVVSRLIGGIYFPQAFFARFCLLLTLLAGAAYPLLPHAGKAGMAAIVVAYAAAYLALIRAMRLIKPEDVAELRALGFVRLNRVIDFFVKKAEAGPIAQD
ncbi:MAG TPA: oligosaccharide flippase family protein [Candidatus Hydrogenedentes bacterium]|nr:oligosaccharide flippase family protein [Candidatus Hydrogenedentota bacterium]HOS02925.1 oligosaccharide flippase family protein [Candidatus Hydrogenedentota bacterium]